MGPKSNQKRKPELSQNWFQNWFKKRAQIWTKKWFKSGPKNVFKNGCVFKRFVNTFVFKAAVNCLCKVVNTRRNNMR